MSDARSYSSDVAFTPAVKAVQARKGSRETYARVEERGGWRTEIDENLGQKPPPEIARVSATHTSIAGRLRNYFLTGLIVAGPLAITA